MKHLRWVVLGLALTALTACVWGGPPSLGVNSPFQVEHNGSLCDGSE
jgi:hypothetical protein